MNNKKKIHIAFDIGVTSVGWCVVDDDGKILDYKGRWWYGVRLFDDASDEKTGDPKNLSRRKARELRRIIRRRHLRNETFIKSLIDNGYVKNKEEFYEIIKNSKDMPVNLKVKGLEKELSKEEWICALFNYLQHRGVFYDVPDDDEKKSDSEKTNTNTDDEKEYSNRIKNEYPSIIQQQHWRDKGYYISSSFNSQISNKRWLEEINVFLSNQNINENVKTKFKELFTAIRDYSKGPGEGSKYGLWTLDPTTGRFTKRDEKHTNLWDKTVGKCSIYPDEKRSIKKSGSAELFNFLNDLQNTRKFSDSTWRISQKEKSDVLKSMLDLKINQKPTLGRIAKALNVDAKDIKWPKTDKKGKTSIEELNNIKACYSILKLTNFEPWLHPEQLNIVNDIVQFKSSIKKMDELQTKIKTTLPNLSNEEINELIKNIKGSSSTHKFSVKALNEFIPKLFNDEGGIEQMQLSMSLFENKNDNENSLVNVNKYIKLKKEEFWSLPLSPASKRAISQTFKVFNKLVKCLDNGEYEIDTVTIEMAREHNSKEQREKIEKLQNSNEEKNEEVITKLKESKSEEYIKQNVTDKVRYKLYLYYQQDKCDIYTNEQIDLNDLIKNPHNYNIDHIIPYSISYNDSRANKVLTSSANNKAKGNMTPYQWFCHKNDTKKYEDLKTWWAKLFNKNISENGDPKKYLNLIYEGNPTEDYNEFASRALNDTRMSTKFAANCFKEYFNKKNEENKAKGNVLYVNGLITNYLRKFTDNFFGEKNRDLYRHHADDAFLLAYISTNQKMLKVFRFLEKMKVDPNKEEAKKILKDNEFDIDNFRKEINEKFVDKNIFQEHMPSFSRQLNNKQKTTQFYNETLYSGKKENDELIKIQKINLRDLTDKQLEEYFSKDLNEKPNEIYMDNHIYQLLKTIYNDDEYKYDEKGKKANPFVQYMKRTKEKIPNVSINNKNLIIFDSKNNKYIVNSIRIKNGKVNKFFENKKLQKSDKHKIGFYDTMSWNCIYVYKKENNKYTITTTNVSNRFGKNLPKPDFKLYRGNVFLLKNDDKNIKHLFYVAGANDLLNTIELKPLISSRQAYTEFYNENLKLKSNQQFFLTINSLFDKFECVEVDEIGNIYKKQVS